MTSYRPTHFRLEELVDPSTFRLLEEKAWWVLDPRLLWTLDKTRDRYQRVVTVNDWLWGGEHTLRGFRPQGVAVGKPHSQHRYGRAIDLDVRGMPADEVRQDILANQDDPAFVYITCLETDITWVHLDVRNWDRTQHGILLVKP